MGDGNPNLPPGFRFYPTDEELVVHFLQRKVSLLPFHPNVIPDLDLYPYDPWDLDGKALAEGKQWYFYSRRTQNRATSNGYWRSTGMEEPIFATSSGRKIGTKKPFAFYVGEAPTGIATDWMMLEYCLPDTASTSRSSKRGGRGQTDYTKWVICTVYERNEDNDENEETELSCLDEVFLSLDDLDEVSLPK